MRVGETEWERGGWKENQCQPTLAAAWWSAHCIVALQWAVCVAAALHDSNNPPAETVCTLVCFSCCTTSHRAVYGAGDLTQANTVFLDSSFGMGYNLRELLQVCLTSVEKETQVLSCCRAGCCLYMLADEDTASSFLLVLHEGTTKSWGWEVEDAAATNPSSPPLGWRGTHKGEGRAWSALTLLTRTHPLPPSHPANSNSTTGY